MSPRYASFADEMVKIAVFDVRAARKAWSAARKLRPPGVSARAARGAGSAYNPTTGHIRIDPTQVKDFYARQGIQPSMTDMKLGLGAVSAHELAERKAARALGGAAHSGIEADAGTDRGASNPRFFSHQSTYPISVEQRMARNAPPEAENLKKMLTGLRAGREGLTAQVIGAVGGRSALKHQGAVTSAAARSFAETDPVAKRRMHEVAQLRRVQAKLPQAQAAYGEVLDQSDAGIRHPQGRQISRRFDRLAMLQSEAERRFRRAGRQQPLTSVQSEYVNALDSFNAKGTTKIAGVGKYLKDSLKWGYYGADPSAPSEKGRLGRWVNRGFRILGPVGVLMDAAPKEDKTGLGRSRTERLVTGAGSELGATLGSGMALRTGFGRKGGWRGVLAGMAGGMLGGTAGHTVTGLPFRRKKHPREERALLKEVAARGAGMHRPIT